jgi:RNA polymerase sigma factor (sigma-70 family)
MSPQTDNGDFTEAWQRDGPRVAAYARRHIAADEAADVVSETFLQAWRHWDDVPRPPLPWLIGTARKVIGNKHRGTGRRQSLQQRLILLNGVAPTAEDAGVLAADRAEALATLASLDDEQREALLLVAWDGLTAFQAAAVIGVRPATFRVRLHRARLAAQKNLDHPNLSPSPPLTRLSLPEGGIS